MGFTRTNTKTNVSPVFSVLSEDQKERLFNGVVRNLRYTGVDVHHEEARKIFEKHNCIVEGKKVFFPPELINYALSQVPRRSEIFAWDGDRERDIILERGRSHFGPGPTPPFTIDPETQQRRKFMRKDASDFTRVLDALPHIQYVQNLGTISDVTDELADVYEFADCLKYTSKPFMGWAFTKENIADQYRIACAYAGGEKAFQKRPNFIYYGEPISPLQSDFEAMDKCMYCAEMRIPQVYTPCTIGGATGPATHAGQIINGLSESMVGVMMSQIISPGTTIIVGGVQSIMDMRHSIYSYGAPELSLMSAALTELAHYAGLPMYSTSGCTDSKSLDVQAAVESSLSINAAMMSGAEFVHDNSYIESGKCSSIFQTVMDNEVIGMAKRVRDGIVVNKETMAVDVIGKVGGGGHYLYEEHTMNHFRSHYMPKLMERRSYEEWAVDKKRMSDRIVEKTRDLLTSHPGTIDKLPKGVEEETRKTLEEAEKRISLQKT